MASFLVLGLRLLLVLRALCEDQGALRDVIAGLEVARLALLLIRGELLVLLEALQEALLLANGEGLAPLLRLLRLG